MVELNEEYFESPYYFFCKEKGDNVAVYFSVSETITESRKNDDVIVVDKEIFKDIQKVISKIINSGKKLSKEYVHKLLDSKAKKINQPDSELGELVNPDGSVIGSSIPILNQRNLAKKTMDQTVRMTKGNQFPFIRVYYGENEDKENNIVSEEDSMCPEHISPSGKKTTMCPDDDDYEIKNLYMKYFMLTNSYTFVSWYVTIYHHTVSIIYLILMVRRKKCTFAIQIGKRFFDFGHFFCPFLETIEKV
jgi:hypothetical protein